MPYAARSGTRKTVMRRTRTVLVLLLSLALLTAVCGGDDDDQQATPSETTGPKLTISSPAEDAEIEGNVVQLNLSAQAIEIKAADGDTSGKTGHFHVFIDREPVAVGQPIPREAGIVHSAVNPIPITGLSVGEHKLTVVFGDGAHTRITDLSDSVTIKVNGPSVDATAPATATAGQPVTVDVKVEGVKLVPGAEDQPPTTETGHLHAFIDVDPNLVAPGASIPVDPKIIHFAANSVTIPSLTAGEHNIWIVLGNGAHVPFEPLVMDKVTITVT